MAPSVLMASCMRLSASLSEADTASKARCTMISLVISMTGLTLARSMKPCCMPVLVKSNDGRRGPVGDDAGVLEARQIGLVVDREQADRADLPVVLGDRAVAGDARRPGVGIERDRRAAGIQDRIAVERLQLAGLASCACARRAYRRGPAGVWMPSQASPSTATSSGLSVRTYSPASREIKSGRTRRRRPGRAPRCDSKVSNFTSSARKPAVQALATLSAIVSSRFCRAICAESAT